MGRVYIATIDNAAAVTQRDILEVTTAAEVPIAITEVYLSTNISKDANEATIELEVARLTGAFTGGSGGTLDVSAYAVNNIGVTDADTTVDIGNTTQISGGTKQVLANIWMNNRLGWHFLPLAENRPIIPGTDAFVVGLTGTIASTAFAGYVAYEKLID